MAPDEEALAELFEDLTDYVHEREEGSALGADIAAHFHRRRSRRFDLQQAGFESFTELLDCAPELSIVGREGSDFVWSAEADLSDLDVDLIDDTSRAEDLILTRFSAQSFKSLYQVEVPLRRFNVLVGANGAGKTSLLEGLFLVTQLRYKKPFAVFSGRRELATIRTAGSHEDVVLRIEDEVHASSITYRGKAFPDQTAMHVVEATAGESTTTYDYSRPLPRPALRQNPMMDAFGGAMLLRLDAANLAQPSLSDREQPSLAANGTGLPSVLANLAATDRDRLDKVFAATRTIIGAFESARMPRRNVSTDAVGNGLELKLRGHWLDARLVSEGTLLVLGLMTLVHGLRSTRLLLLDDIDRALHPKAQRALAIHLAEMAIINNLQVVCTTHSPYLLDAVDAEDVHVVRAEPSTGHSHCRRLVAHHSWEKWRRTMTPGVFWSYVGEDWLEAE